MFQRFIYNQSLIAILTRYLVFMLTDALIQKICHLKIRITK